MIPVQFEYAAPTSVEEALSLMTEHGDEAKVLAGGQSLLPVMRMRLNAPEWVIDLGRIDALRGVSDGGDAIEIGAMTTHHDVLHNTLVAEHALLITKAVEHLADAQIRHRGTFGGALAHADPAGDLGAPALALGAEFVIQGPAVPEPSARTSSSSICRDRDRRRRAARRDPCSQAHRVGSALREVRAGGPPVADRGCRGHRADGRRRDCRGTHRADQHGIDAGARHRRGGRPARSRSRCRGSSRRAKPRTARTRRATSTATPTTASTSRPC